jgi:hypothetical protein
MAASPATAYRRLAGLGERLHRELLRRPNVAARIDCPLAAIFVRFLGGPQTYRVITPGRAITAGVSTTSENWRRLVEKERNCQ